MILCAPTSRLCDLEGLIPAAFSVLESVGLSEVVRVR